MDNQTKIDTLKVAIKDRTAIVATRLRIKYSDDDTLVNLKEWLQELEQSNNKDNIDNWTHRELFDYCAKNKLINTVEWCFKELDNKHGKTIMLGIITLFKSQK